MPDKVGEGDGSGSLEAIPGLWLLSLQTYNTSAIYDGHIDRTEQCAELQLVEHLELILPLSHLSTAKKPAKQVQI